MANSAQPDDTTLYLIDEEMALVPGAAKSAWAKRIKKETLTAYETPAQIDARMKAVNYSKYPKLKAKIDGYVADIKAGKKPDVSFEDFPEEAIGSFLYSIGASGISFYLHLYLSDKTVYQNNDVMESIAALSRARHRILEKNQAVFA